MVKVRGLKRWVAGVGCRCCVGMFLWVWLDGHRGAKRKGAGGWKGFGDVKGK